MGEIILVTGGSRSGKSAYAQRLAESIPGPRVFVATGLPIDDEMRDRIRKHQEARKVRNWQTLEEPLDLSAAIGKASNARCILVDCLTLWINNLMYQGEQAGVTVSESDIHRHCHQLLAACARYPGTILFVTSEVGMGIVPDNPLSRLYRDLVGRCNQIIADASNRVILLVSGQPLELKKETLDER